MSTSKQNQSAVREVNRMLLQTIRTDWKFPNPPSPSTERIHEPVTYRERFYSTSDDSSSDSIGETEEDGEASEAEDPSVEDGATFESPDSVSLYIDRRIQATKRKKKKLLEDELKWNPGLCYFMRRRNAWTGAVSPDKVKDLDVEEDTVSLSTVDSSTQSTKDEKTPKDPPPTTESTNPVAVPTPEQPPAETGPASTDTDSGIVIPETEIQTKQTPFDPPIDSTELTTILIPISKPLLPQTHPVRSSIMSRTTSELYEKVVRDSRTPAVPINLAHMMRVMVQGWKDEGNWPPKGTGTGPTQNLMFADTASVGKSGRNGGGASDLLANHKHLRSGVDSVKRVLRLNRSATPAGD